MVGLTRMKEIVEVLRPELRAFCHENNDEFLDLLEVPLPRADAPAPVRFMPDYANLNLSSRPSTRDLQRAPQETIPLRRPDPEDVLLVDRFVRGTRKIEKTQCAATLVIEPFEPLPKNARGALMDEGEQLVRFVGADAASFAVRFVGR